MQSTRLTVNQELALNDAAMLAQLSDGATKVHEWLGYALAAEMQLHNQPTWKEVGMHAVASLLDLVDGKLKDMAVRRASSILIKHQRDIRHNKPTEKEWVLLGQHGIVDKPREDEKTDKRYFYTVMGSLAVRMLRNGHNKTATVLAANMAVSGVRDKAKGDLRNYAEQNKLSTHAKKLGKCKTLLHGVGMGVLLMPIANNDPGRAIGSSLICLGTSFGLADYRQYRRYIRHEEIAIGLLS